jgi:choline dehydrogenase-like flavoprotein
MNWSGCDAIVVGSGAGGAAAAYGLVRAGLKVLLLEKGDHLPTDGSTLDVMRVVGQGEFLSREAWLDGRGATFRPEEHFNVGGKTKWYGAALLRFSEREFSTDLAHGCRGWPISLSTLTPYYDDVERLLGVRTFDCEPDLTRILARVSRAGGHWQSQPMPMGLAADIVQDPMEAMHFDGFASVRGFKSDADTSFLAILRGHEGFQMLTNAEVHTLIGSAQDPLTVVGVRLRDGQEYFAPRVLLAAGALHSPRLLDRYLIANSLTARLPGAAHIGRYLKLHLLTAMLGISHRRLGDLIRKTVVLTSERYPHSSLQPLGFDAEVIASLMPKWVPGLLGMQFGKHAYGFFLQTEDGSSFDNCVRGERDTPVGTPVLDYQTARVPAAEREHRAFNRAFILALARSGLLAFGRRIGLAGTAHVCGTLICGNSPADSVVDAQGRVHGMNGLYVSDGSVLPRSSRVNPSLTIYAWALRCADLIAREAGADIARRRGEGESLRAK